METDDIENFDDVTDLKSYSDFLDKFITKEDKIYLEDIDLARDVKELYAVNKGDIKTKEDFDRKKRELVMLDQEKDQKGRQPFSDGKEYPENSFLWHLKEREYDVQNGRKSTIIFIRYRESNGREVSAYIDYRDRLKDDSMELVFNGEKHLVPRPSDLSYYNWTAQKAVSNDSTFFRVDAGPKERLSFKNNTDRKIINVDYEYLEKHKHLEVIRSVVDFFSNPDKSAASQKLQSQMKEKLNINPPKNKRLSKVTPVNLKNKTKLKEEDLDSADKDNFGYQQIVIFDYEARNK